MRLLFTFLVMFLFLTQNAYGWTVLNDLKNLTQKTSLIEAPINKTTNSIEALANESIPLEEFKKITADVEENLSCPTDLAGLTDGWDIFSYSISDEMAAQMNLYSTLSANADSNITYYLYYLMYYKDVKDVDGYTTNRCGAGIRLSLSIKKLTADASLDNLPAIAASAQLNKSKVEYKISTFGLSGPKIREAIPDTMQGSFDLDGHLQLFKAVDKIKAAVEDTGTVVTPATVKIKYTKNDDEEYVKSMATIWALLNIRDGEKCSTAKKNFKSKNDIAIDTISTTYESLAEKCSSWGSPNNVAQLKARNILEKYGYSDIERETLALNK